MRRFFGYISVSICSLLMTSSVLLADVAAVSTSPARTNVSVTRSTIVTINWTVEQDTGGVELVSSPLGQFVANNQILATVSTSLSKLSPASATVRITHFSETIEIPSSVVIQALKLGASSVHFQRTFSDSGGSAVGFFNLAPTGSGGADFLIPRIELKFDDEARVRVVPQATALTAIAEINFSGSGRLRAEWVVRDPTNIAGDRFRTLAIVSKNLAGGRRLTIRSPELPTSIEGPYQLEFRVVEPVLNRLAPSLEYYVTGKGTGAPSSATTLRVTGPSNGALLNLDSLFSWEPVEGADIYVLEVYFLEPPHLSELNKSPLIPSISSLKPAQKPVAGKIVRAKITRTSLAEITTAHLIPNTSYVWLVKAIGPQGQLIRQSALNEVLYSP